ncbi:MAG: AAA family ATPase [Bacteroidetes bacterium]|nr:MAG: AAA family ATPase [Bacteroidota bacterium]
MKKILITGCCGAGKSTLATRLSALTGLPLIHLDQHYWQAGWQESSPEEWPLKVQQLAAQQAYIMDGNYRGSLHLRLPHADAVVYLDLPRWQCMLNVIKRWAQYHGNTRPDMAAGCPERMDVEFLHYVWTFKYRKRPAMMKLLKQLQAEGQKAVFILKNKREIDSFLATFSADQKS